MQIGLMLRHAEHSEGRMMRWPELRDLALAAEAVGIDSLWVPDHLLFRTGGAVTVPGGGTSGVWEGWTLLTAIAAVTKRPTLGPFVACTSFRNPALLAKMAVTLDEVSDGRLVLGLGAGWHEPEFDAFGYPFDHRVSRFEEAVQIIAPLLRTGQVDFEGRYYTARDVELRPRGPRPYGPPIWIGARMPRMLGLAARYADAYNTDQLLEPYNFGVLREMFGRLTAACGEVGRDPADVRRTSGCVLALGDAAAAGAMAGVVRGSNDEILEWLGGLRDEGVDHLTVWLWPWTRSGVEQLAPIVEAAHALG
ncbi:MAG: LLM class flavin-dependent oxidoreductase [Chloroflexi bacterium]|nr:LLM class flavin-dependent oxidoreductase [Chloroflexota bacterium]